MGGNSKSNVVLTARDVARILKINIDTVLLWSKMGVLKPYRTSVNGEQKYQREDIKSFLKK